MIAPSVKWLSSFDIPETYALYDVVTALVASANGTTFLLTKESITKFSSTGALIWQKPFGGTDLIIGSNDLLYLSSRLTGNSANSSESLSQLDNNGNVIWKTSGGYKALTTTPDGAIIALPNGSNAAIKKLSLNGNLIWEKNIDFYLTEDIAVGQNGSIFVVGWTSTNGGDGVVSAFDSLGKQIWTQTLGTSAYDSIDKVIVSPDGSIYVAGQTQGNLDNLSTDRWIRDGFLVKYSSSGQKLWSQLIGAADGSGVQSLSIGTDGSIYVTGSTGRAIDGQPIIKNGTGLSTDAYVVSFSPSGSRLWTKIIGTSLQDEGDALAVGDDGSIYLGGISGANIIGSVPKYSIQGFLTKLEFASFPTYSLKASSTTINEGSTATFTLSTTNVVAGTAVAYTLSGISASDVLGGSLSGTAVVNSSGTATISVALLNDQFTEGSETLTVSAGGASASTVVNDTSISALVDDYPWSTGTSGILNTSGTTLNGNIEIYDDYDLFKVNLIAGSTYTIALVSQTTAGLTDPFLLLYNPSVTFLLDDDNSGGGLNSRISYKAEATGTYYVGVRHSTLTGTGGYKVSVKLESTPTFALSGTNSSVNEGSTATFTLTTTNVAAGTSVSFTLAGISTADLAIGSLSGTTTVASNGQATISVILANDNLTEGTETLTVTAGGASASAQINDTSKSAATYLLSANSISVNEGATATFLLTTTNVAAGTSIGYNISGISIGDLSSGSLIGTTTVATNGQASITINLANDNLTEGSETLTVLAQGQTASTLVNDTSKSNTSTFPTVLTLQQMQNAPALTFTAFTPTDPAIKWNFSSFFFGTNLLGKDFNPTSFYASASSIYDFNALSIDDPDYLAIFDSNGNLITSSSESKDWAGWVDSSGNSYDYDNISSWSPPKDGTYYLGVVLSQTSTTPFYSFGGYETRATVTSIPFGNGKYFYGSSGPDNVIGTSYVDILKQTSNSASNLITKLADGSWQVQNKITPSNSDNLVNVERIEFSNMSVALDVSGPAGQVAKILGSVFGKSNVSNTVFAGIGLAYLDGGMSYLDLCGLAAGAAGLSTPDLLITTLLRNTTGTEPTALSKSSYLTSISSGASYASVVQQIADSSANAQSIKLTDLANTGLAYTPYVLPPTYSLNASTALVNEGSTAVFNLTTTNVAVGSEVSYTISGVSSADLTSGTLAGKVSIGVGGTASISVPIAADSATEGQETLTINAQGASATMVINDTSKGNATPTYSLTPATNSINEGVLAQVYVSTTNVAAGTSLQFGISGVGITQGDVIEGLSRFVTIDSTGKAVININTVADQLTEGPETMFITLGTSTTSIVMNDTSVTLVGIPDGGGDGGGGGGGGGAGGGD